MRRHYLDNIRWTTIIFVVIFHVVYMFNGEATAGVVGPFKTPQYQDALQYILYPWMMVLLFIVSGMCARYYFENHDVKQFIKSRTTKLLVPSTVGLFVFQWIQGYFNMRLSGAFEKNEIPAFAVYPIMALSGTGVLWFIQMLWLFSMILALIRHFESGKLYGVTERTNLAGVFALGIVIYAASFALNAPVIVCYRFGIYGAAFFIGYFVLAHDEVIEKLSKVYVPLYIAAMLFAASYIYFYFGRNFAENPVFNSVPAMCYCWSMCLAILGSFYKWANKRTKLSEFMTARSYGLYIFHYLPLSASAYLLNKYAELPARYVYLIVLVCGFAGGFALNELMSRIPFVRWATLGIKKKTAK